MTELPGVLQQIASVVGEEAALAIATARGGTQVYIPPVPPSDHWLCKLIGVERARRLADELTMGIKGLRLELPLGPASNAAQARARVDAMIKAGASERDICLATRYSIRSIRRRRAMLNTDQLSLF
ncbi:MULTISPECIES: helix-turn-helix domain-containing protein [unclassified Novosphingobium]|uniref:helix-turn-helix domain-containing protein n=1 Tax=unclassified Novosphingobium TaxID=2644732 RepID=UPI000D322068|nr:MULTISPECIES: helix-turn-helix domain-containing protein [unclassified Novosphingobium]PTR11784.1 hypothetical protein C8K11_104143 [Novosphingobium sp. GV055]PUB04824.1 hypothetical protein C8K12_104143 [Novosphingobium sp. GV061]PUB21143.1 hypothetical protein C8K14_104143 [Novosphingobium sp. GV079]PUB42869.1 hypothetical protein C8K10_104143 [Novosphingobium sp. GV027]